MKFRKLMGSKMAALVNCLALLLVMQTANSACLWIVHQPEFPKEADKFKKCLNNE